MASTSYCHRAIYSDSESVSRPGAAAAAAVSLLFGARRGCQRRFELARARPVPRHAIVRGKEGKEQASIHSQKHWLGNCYMKSGGRRRGWETQNIISTKRKNAN